MKLSNIENFCVKTMARTAAFCVVVSAFNMISTSARGDAATTNAANAATPGIVPMTMQGDPTLGWVFGGAQEGATGSLTLNPNSRDGHDTLLFAADFAGGTHYLEYSYVVPNLDVSSVSMYLYPKNLTYIRLRIEDSTEQWHQIKVQINPDSGWNKWTFSFDDFFSGKRDPSMDPEYTSWNGANDQKWHGPMKSFNVMLEVEGDTKESLGVSDATLTLKK
jgi:hypothetical protein